MGSPGADATSTWPCGLIETSGDSTILWVNDAFLEWTGRTRADLEGRRLRDLLTVGSRIFYETHVAPMVRLRGLASELALDLLGADGTRLAALVNVTAGRGGADQRLNFSVVAATQRRSYERELVQARLDAEAATESAERAQDRLQLAAEVNVVMSEGPELHPALQRLAELISCRRDCACVIVDTGLRPSEPQAVVQASTTSTASIVNETVAALVGGGDRDGDGSPQEWPALLRTPVGRLVARPQSVRTTADDRRRPDNGTSMIVPIRVREKHLGVITLVRAPGDAPFDQSDLDEISALSSRIGLQMENIRLSAGEHDRASALQRALLTPAAQSDALEITATYLPSADGAMVGGDWYDSLVRPDGTTVLVIGDVTGHDHIAAAVMGQLRGLVRAVAYLSVDSPAGVLSTVDSAALGLGLNALATAILAYLSPPDHLGRRELQWANAGHLPPAVLSAAGTVRFLDRSSDLLLGVHPDWTRHDHRHQIAAGDTLLLYTDGLIESRARDIDAGLSALHTALVHAAGRPVDVLSSEVVAAMSTEPQEDDIAVLVVRNVSSPA